MGLVFLAIRDRNKGAAHSKGPVQVPRRQVAKPDGNGRPTQG